MKDGYFQIHINEQSQEYCVFGTPFRRYAFCRSPFGISSAPRVFQKRNYEIFGEGVGLYFDDLIIRGNNETEHDNNLRLVLERAQKYNIRFNKGKIQFKSKCVKFMGQIYSKEGAKLNKNYVTPILEMPKTKDKT